MNHSPRRGNGTAIYQQASTFGDKRPFLRGTPLNPQEFERLDGRVKRSHLSRETYLRQLMDGYLPTDTPPPDYYAMMKELYRIGNNLTKSHRKLMC